MEDIELGDEVKDKITGFSGIAVARTQWITGCDRITIRPRTLKKEGGIHDIETFDEQQLTIVKKRALILSDVETPKKEKRGGPGPNPTKPSNPSK